jgi:twitching motility protein PilT
MSQLTAMIGVLRRQDGDELILEADASPQFLAHGQGLRLFLRAIPADRHQLIVDELLDAEQRQELAAKGTLVVDHEDAEHGSFAAHLRGAGGERIRLVRHGADEAPQVEASVATEDPPSSPVLPDAVAPSNTADPTRGEASPQLQQLLAYARECRASDLHLATGEPATLRIDGRLMSTGGHEHDPAELLRGLLSDADEAALASRRSVDLAIALPDGGRFRLNAYRHDRGMAAAIRVLRPAPPSLAQLQLPADLSWVTQLSHGLVLLCGPTGSGKSTTMAALMRELMQQRGGVSITLEDPIEYTFEAPSGALVRQREVGRDVADFPSGLRDALREDPDVLLVGEMRDAESIQLALTAAETGHIVLSSLHSRSAAAAVERIVDAYPPERQRQVRVQLADALRGVISRRLLPKATGSGRVPALEVLRVNQAAAAMIRDGKTPQLVSVMQTGMQEGMQTMERCVKRLVASGVVAEADTAP